MIETGRRLLRTTVAATAMLALVAAPAVGAVAEDGSGSISGTLPDGTGYGYVVPPDWNGTLIIDPDFIGFGGGLPNTDAGMNGWLLDAGFAVGGTSRVPTMDRVQESVAAMMGGLDLFEEEFAPADVTVVKGGSLGGFTSRAAIEIHPDRIDGALAMCGGGAGLVGGWNQKLDAAFVAKALIAPDSDLELVDITDAGAATTAWNELIADVRDTPEARARLALASAVGQVPTTGDDREAPLPDAGDYDEQLDRQIDVFQMFVRPQIRSTIESVTGGNISWNHGVDYAEQLAGSGLSDLVEYHYAQAGLDLDADLAELAELPRISADPAAVAWAEDNIVYSGDTGGGPVLSIHTAGDRSESLAFDAAYAQTFREAGNAALLRQAWVERAGHCSFTDAERLTALLTLLERVETGTWPSTDAADLNARAAEHGVFGEAAFFTPEVPDFLRPWDARDAGTYQPAGEEPEEEYVTVQGIFHEGEPGQVVYEAIKPPEWNGTLILDLDFNGWRPDRRQFFLDQGYAIGGNQRTQNETAYELKDYVDNLVRTRELLTEAIAESGAEVSEPTRTIAWGNSRGGFVARMAAQYRPDIFDAGLGSAGGGAGVIGSWLGKADAVWALQELVDPDAGLAVNDLPDIPEGASYGPGYDQDVRLNELVSTARSSDVGLARLVLAAAFSQATDFPGGPTPPAADDYRDQGERIAASFGFGHPQFVHKEIEVMGGGPVVWNHGIDHRDLLERSGAKERVEWWYEHAGLDLEADLDRLAEAPRYGADPAAVATVEDIGTFNGTGSPVLTIKSRGDAADSPSLDGAYVDTFAASGNPELVRALMIDRSGHGGQTFGEHLAAFEVLEERLDTGVWPDTSPEAMNARVAELAERLGTDVVGSAEGRYMPFDDIPPALRTWDFTDRGTYEPALSSNLTAGQTVTGTQDVVFTAVDANPVEYQAQLYRADGTAVDGVGVRVEAPTEGRLTLPGVDWDALAGGEYELVFTASYRDGHEVTLAVPLVREVTDTPEPQPTTPADGDDGGGTGGDTGGDGGGRLPSTGAPVAVTGLAVLALLSAGAGLVTVRRRAG